MFLIIEIIKLLKPFTYNTTLYIYMYNLGITDLQL